MVTKRIAIVCPGFPIPTETFIITQVVCLIKLGYEVDIFPYKRWPDLPGDFDTYRLGLRVFPAYIPSKSYGKRFVKAIRSLWNFPGNRLALFKTLNPLVLGKPAFDLTVFYSALSFLNKPDYDAVVANFGESGVGMEKLLRCGFLKVPLIVWYHGYDMSVHSFIDDLLPAYQKVFRRSKFLVGVSKKMCARLVELGCEAEKAVYLPYAPKEVFGRLTINYSSSTFISVGRFVEKKAPHLTILSFERLRQFEPDAVLVMVGDGPLRNSAELLVKERGLQNVIFKGVLSHEETLKCFETAFCYVQHSVTAENGDSEGTPVGILEAGAAALPVVSTCHAGIIDVVKEGVTGFLVKERDIMGMSDAMLRLYRDRKMCKHMGIAARTHVLTHFSMEKFLTQVKVLIDKAIEKPL